MVLQRAFAVTFGNRTGKGPDARTDQSAILGPLVGIAIARLHRLRTGTQCHRASQSGGQSHLRRNHVYCLHVCGPVRAGHLDVNAI